MIFQSVIFGPIKSRRLGTSLGVNLPPTDAKVCSFDCIYCECGYNFSKPKMHVPTRGEVREALQAKLAEMRDGKQRLDTITFAGNGEPTMHRDFAGIIDDTVALRDEYFPEAKISVLSNSTQIGRDDVFQALLKIDQNILKLDSAVEETFRRLNQPAHAGITAESIIEKLERFGGRLIIQTLFLRGEHNGMPVDNTTPEEIEAWTAAIRRIRPQKVMIYAIDRQTPEKSLEKIAVGELERIAEGVRTLGIEVSVAG